MEAAVLPPAALPEVDCSGLSAELEVKKLQELVRKLERQNEQLRTRSGAPAPAPGPRLCPLPSSGVFCPPEAPLDYFQAHGAAEGGSEPSVLDELELLDLDSVSGSDASDETWLYAVPTATAPPGDAPPPLQWCRRVLDGPKTEVDAARHSLALQLDQVSSWRSSRCSASPSSSSCSSSSTPPLNRVTPIIPAPPPPASFCSAPPTSERHAPPPLSSPLHPALHRSPVGKELPPVAERTPTFLPHPPARSRGLRGAPLSPQSSVDSEDDSIALGYKLQDLTDVQVMARLQEESLRQDLAGSWSALAGRRSHSFSFQLSAALGLEEEDEEEDDEDYGLLPPPQPRLPRLRHSHTFCSAPDWRRSTSSLCTPPSTPSTPPHCPTAGGFTCRPQAPPTADPPPPSGFRPTSAEYDSKLRRSMPNLLRAPGAPPAPASPSPLRNSQSFDSPGGLARLQSSIPSPGQLQTRVQSVGSFSSLSRPPPKATAYVSPTVKGSASVSLQALSGIPLLSKPGGGASRSGLPRPASFVGTTGSAPRGKPVQTARSLLTSPNSLSTFSALRDAAWRDGCY